MTPYSCQRSYDVSWTQATETAAVKAQQRPPMPEVIVLAPEPLPCDASPSAELQEHIMAVLRERGGATQRALATALGEDGPTIGKSLFTLKRRGDIEANSHDYSQFRALVWRIKERS